MSTRTPTDYALEFAEYMAKGAERLLEAINQVGQARMDLEDPADGDDEDRAQILVDEAEELHSEAYRALLGNIYEFRKRRDRAAIPSAAPVPDKEPGNGQA